MELWCAFMAVTLILGFWLFFLFICGKFPISDSLVLGITLIIDCNFTLSHLRPIQNLFSTYAHFWPQLQYFPFILTNQNKKFCLPIFLTLSNELLFRNNNIVCLGVWLNLMFVTLASVSKPASSWWHYLKYGGYGTPTIITLLQISIYFD